MIYIEPLEQFVCIIYYFHLRATYRFKIKEKKVFLQIKH